MNGVKAKTLPLIGKIFTITGVSDSHEKVFLLFGLNNETYSIIIGHNA